jgi:hypothetical protein
MAQAPDAVRLEVAALASAALEDRLDWGDFLQSLPDGIGEDELIHELITALGAGPLPGFVSEEAYELYRSHVRGLVAQLEGRTDGAI